jgi:hypothetical protein
MGGGGIGYGCLFGGVAVFQGQRIVLFYGVVCGFVVGVLGAEKAWAGWHQVRKLRLLLGRRGGFLGSLLSLVW